MTELNVMCEAVRYQKTLTDNTFEILSLLQKSSNEAFQQSLEQCSWLPEETKQDYNQWVSYSRSASDDLKKLMDGCYQQLEQQFALWGEESASPTEEIIAEAPLIETKVAVTRKVSAVKTKVTATSSGQSKTKSSSTSTGAENRKASPATAPRSNRKKPATKTQSAKTKSTGQSNAKRSSTPTGAENRKASPAAAARSSRKKPATKTQSTKKEAAVKE